MKVAARDAPVVYIASAYSGDITGNITKTKAYSRAAIAEGAIPINPILNLDGVLNEQTDREVALSIDLSLLRRADAVWCYGIPTAGMKLELAEAKRNGIEIRFLPDTQGRVFGGTL